MDVVLVGLPGSGKTAVGRRLARRHGATFIDLDTVIEEEAGRRIPDIFASEGEAGFRARERRAVADLGPPDPGRRVRRVVATGGGAVVDPRNRWHLYHGRAAVWLDGPPEAVADRLVRSPNVRPLIVGRDPVAAVRDLADERRRFYAAAPRVDGMAELNRVVDDVEAVIASRDLERSLLLAADTPIGRLRIGSGMAAATVGAALDRQGARRALVVTEPVAWRAVETAIAAALAAAARDLTVIELPTGEAAKTLAAVEVAASRLAEIHAERGEPIVAVGGGTVGDAAGFLAAIWLRGVPLIHVPTTMAAQVDSAIGGKTAVDLPAGKNLLGSFHQPTDIILDVALLQTLPARERRAALGEVVKMGILGDDRLLELLEERGSAIAAGAESVFADGSIAEAVERCAWVKIETVSADERETGEQRITLNLGHTIGHAIETADGYATLRHGEAVAYGLRAACRIGVAVGATPEKRADRVERLLDALGLAIEPLGLAADTVRSAMAVDKKVRGGRLRFVLPTENGVEVRDDVPEKAVMDAITGILADRRITVSGGSG